MIITVENLGVKIDTDSAKYRVVNGNNIYFGSFGGGQVFSRNDRCRSKAILTSIQIWNDIFRKILNDVYPKEEQI